LPPGKRPFIESVKSWVSPRAVQDAYDRRSVFQHRLQVNYFAFVVQPTAGIFLLYHNGSEIYNDLESTKTTTIIIIIIIIITAKHSERNCKPSNI
jgi:hypothetical protein